MLRPNSMVIGTLLLASAGLLIAWTGCGRPAPEVAPQVAPPPDAAEAHSHNDHDRAHAGGHPTGDPKVQESLAQLSAEDRALAEKQRICPVSGQLLGSMGTPVKLTVEGREVFICCEGCEDTLRADPEKHFQKLDHAQAP